MANLSNINNKFLVTTGGNVLIGQTADDGNRLQIDGDAIIKNGTYGKILLRSSSNYLYGDANGVLIAAASDNLRLYTAGTQRLRIDSSGNSTFAGQVSVAFSNPDVSGIELQATVGTNAAAIKITNTGGNFYIGKDKSDGSRISGTAYANAIWAENANPLVFGVSNSEKMRITSGARINMDVMPTLASEGVIRIGRYDANISRYNEIQNSVTSNGAASYMNLSVHSGTENVVTDVMTLLGSGNVGIGVAPNDWDPTITALQIDAVSISAFLNNVMLIGGNAYYDDTANAYKYINDGFASQLTVNNSGNFEFKTAGSGTAGGTVSLDTKVKILNNGSVGIGVTSPNAKLHVMGTTGLPATSGTTFTGTMRLGVSGYGTVMDFGAVGPATGTQWIQVTDASNQAIQYPLLLQPNGGNVGIGTDSPESLLHIKGETRAYISFQDTTDGYFGFVGDATNMLTSGTVDNLGLRGEAGIQFGVSDVIKMVLDSSGNLGIGVTPTNWNTITPIQVKNSAFSGLSVGTTHVAYMSSNFFYESADKYIADGYATMYSQANGKHSFYTAPENTSGAGAGLTLTESMRITSGGIVGIGDSNPTLASRLVVAGPSGSSNVCDIRTGTTANLNVGAIVFRNSASAYCGQITVNGATAVTSYLSASDYRLKEDLKDFKGLDLVSNIKVYDYKWKSADERTYGVVAHELQEVLPQAVDGNKDDEQMQGVDYSKIVPLLVKSIQELKAEIELLKSK